MRKFVIKAIIFFVLFTGVCWIIELSGVFSRFLPNRITYNKIELSKTQIDGAQYILLGDSVVGSLYKNYDSGKNGVVNLACNQAIDVIGHYLLLKNFLEKNKNVEKVYFFYNPFSFSNNIDHVFSYNYFIKPFYKREYKKYFTKRVLKQIRSYPLSYIARFPLIAITYFTPEIEREKPDFFISPISCEYLTKMKELADEHGVELLVLPPPTRESRKNEVERLKDEYTGNKCNNVMITNYFDKIIYTSDNYFQDDVHFKREYYSKGREYFSKLAELPALN